MKAGILALPAVKLHGNNDIDQYHAMEIIEYSPKLRHCMPRGITCDIECTLLTHDVMDAPALVTRRFEKIPADPYWIPQSRITTDFDIS